MFHFKMLPYRQQQRFLLAKTVWIIDIKQLVTRCSTTPALRPKGRCIFTEKSCLMKLQREQMEGKPITCKQTPRVFFFLVIKDASVLLDGFCPTHTAAKLAAVRRIRHPPPSTTVQQLWDDDPRGALLASTPTRGTPWCQNKEHSGTAQTARSRANRQKLSKTHSSAVRSPPACRPTGMCDQSEAAEVPKLALEGVFKSDSLNT